MTRKHGLLIKMFEQKNKKYIYTYIVIKTSSFLYSVGSKALENEDFVNII